MIKRITNVLDLQFVTPEEIVIKQNDEIYDVEKEQFLDESYFYIIMNGNFKVTSG